MLRVGGPKIEKRKIKHFAIFVVDAERDSSGTFVWSPPYVVHERFPTNHHKRKFVAYETNVRIKNSLTPAQASHTRLA